MQIHYETLISLLDNFPRHNSQSGINELSTIFNQYKSILDRVHNTNENLMRTTIMFYTEIDDIKFDIEQAEKASSSKQKDRSFYEAISHLRSDISDLAELIKPHNEC
jgi:hypothetical protein